MSKRPSFEALIGGASILLLASAAWAREVPSKEEVPKKAGTHEVAPSEKAPNEGAPDKGAPGAKAGNDSSFERLLPYYSFPLVIPPKWFAPLVQPIVVKTPASPPSYSLNVGFFLGVVPGLHIEGILAPIVTTPEVKYGNPQLAAVFGLVAGPRLDVATKVSATLDTGDKGTWLAPLSTGVLVAARLGAGVRIDAGAFANMNVGAKGDERGSVGIDVPVGISFQLGNLIALIPRSGYTITNLRQAGDTMAIPLGISTMTVVRLSKKGYGFFAAPFFQWPTFATPAVDGKIHTDVLVAGLNVAPIIPF